jgi:hypothetical protein
VYFWVWREEAERCRRMTEKSDTSVLAKIERIDRRVLYWVLILLIVVPTLSPIGLPIPISEMSRKFYTALQAVPNGGVVLLDCSLSVGSLPEIGPGGEVMGKYLATKPVKVIIWSVTNAEGPMLAEQYVVPSFQKAGKKYGTDYVNLGYIPGEDITLAKLAADISYIKKDYHGTDTAQLPLLKDVKTAKDVALAIVIEAGGEIKIAGSGKGEKAIGKRYRGMKRWTLQLRDLKR